MRYVMQNNLDRDLDDIYLGRDPEDASVCHIHSLFKIRKRVTYAFSFQSLFGDSDIAIHLESGSMQSSSRSRSNV